MEEIKLKKATSHLVTMHDVRPWNARPICAAGRFLGHENTKYSTHHTAVASASYIRRLTGYDRFGKLPGSYAAKAADLQAVGRSHPMARIPHDMRSGMTIWHDADTAVAGLDPTSPVAMHVVATLPIDDTLDQWVSLVEDYAAEAFASRGMVSDWALHALADENGGWAIRPHAHFIVTLLNWRTDRRLGKRNQLWLASDAQLRTAERKWYEMSGVHPIRLP